jgi:hopanoid biosynthesis associated RND transporter like protein HpnN
VTFESSVEPETKKSNWRDVFANALSAFICRFALWIVIASLMLAAGAGLYAWKKLTFMTDRNALVDPEADFNKRFLRFSKAFGDQEYMLVVITPAPGPIADPGFNPPQPDEATRAEMKTAAREVALKLRARPEHFPMVVERVDPEEFGGTRMLYMPTKDLEVVAKQVEEGKAMLNGVAADPSFPGLLRGMKAGIEQGSASDNDEAKIAKGGEQMAALIKTVRSAASGEQATEMFAFSSSDPTLDKDGFFFSWEGRMLFVVALPAKNHEALDQIKEPLAYARSVAEEIDAKHPKLAVGLTGRPAIYSDEMASTDRDMLRATILSLIAVLILFAAWFRGLIKPLYAMFSLGIALVWTLGATTLVIGHLNIFSMVFMPVLVGLGIDYGIQKLNNYQMGILRGLSVRDALTDTYSEIGVGTITCAITAAAALGTAAFTGFMGLAELGIISAMGIMLCLVSMMIVLPALLALHDRKRLRQGNPVLLAVMAERKAIEIEQPEKSHIGPGTRWLAALVTLIAVAGLVVFCVQLGRGWTLFNYNLLEITDPTSEAVGWERLLIDHDQRASFAVSLRHSPEEIAELRKRFEPLVKQGVIREMESLVPPQEQSNRKLLSRLDNSLPLSFAERGKEPTTARNLLKAARELQAALLDVSSRTTSLERALQPAVDEISTLAALCRESPQLVEANLANTEGPFFAAMRHALVNLKRDASPPAITEESMPASVRNRYVGHVEGEKLYALYLYPAQNVWVHENAVAFNEHITKIDPDITGVTIQIQYSADIIVNGFTKSVIYASIAIVLLLFLDFRKPLATLIAMIPLIGGLAILGGLMAAFGWQFNFANFFAVSILIGTAIDAGVYLVHSQRADDPVRVLKQTRGACVVCSMTTVLGFGALMIASHKGVFSLGLLLAVGMTAAVFVAFFVVPVVLAWFNARGKRV